MKNKFRKIVGIVLLGILESSALLAGNPLVPKVSMADPHIHIFNNIAYLYSTRDADSTAHTFVMPDWKIWSSKDLVNWKLERTISPTETYMGQSNRCWAPDVACKNDSWFFYFSNGNSNTGVLKGSSPTGPFVDVLGKPMLSEDLTTGKEYDITVLVDDDGIAYVAFGHYRADDNDLNYYIAKLGKDMMSLAEKPKVIKIIGDADVLTGNDKPTLHKRNGIYYLSAGTHYATAKNIYGPYIRCGNSGNNEYGLSARAHGNYFEWKNQWFHVWCDFYLGKEVAYYRKSYLTYLHYKDNGEMVDDVDFLDAHFTMGVGQYDVSWDKIEAEWYMAADKIQKREGFYGGFEIQHVKNDGFLYFPNIKNMDKSSSITFHLSSVSGGTIEVRANSKNGPVLGSAKVSGTGGFANYKNISCNLSKTQGVNDIYFVFKGKSDDLFHLDWFKFELK